jgi:serine/threonine-protein kinase RIO1
MVLSFGFLAVLTERVFLSRRDRVQMWAEKEFRNLNRLHAAGVRCPRPLLLKVAPAAMQVPRRRCLFPGLGRTQPPARQGHVLAMEFVGYNGTAAAKLKHAGLDGPGWERAYEESLEIVRALFQARAPPSPPPRPAPCAPLAERCRENMAHRRLRGGGGRRRPAS